MLGLGSVPGLFPPFPLCSSSIYSPLHAPEPQVQHRHGKGSEAEPRCHLGDICSLSGLNSKGDRELGEKKKIQINPNPLPFSQQLPSTGRVCATTQLVLLRESTNPQPEPAGRVMKHSWEFLWLNSIKNSLEHRAVSAWWRGKEKKLLFHGTALPAVQLLLVLGQGQRRMRGCSSLRDSCSTRALH